MTTKKVERRIKIKYRVRKRISGTAERPRLSVFRSNKQIYAQVINDLTGTTIASASSLGLEKMPKKEQAAINRVTKVTKGGRTFTFAAIVVVGDGKGVIGYGLGKAGEVTAAIAKGVEAAKKNLVKVPVLKGTIPHEVEARFGGAQVFMRPAAAGTGLVAGGAMRAVLDSVGVKDILAKSKGSSNPHNLVKATIAALSELRDAYTVAGQRGICMDKVFNG